MEDLEVFLIARCIVVQRNLSSEGNISWQDHQTTIEKEAGLLSVKTRDNTAGKGYIKAVSIFAQPAVKFGFIHEMRHR